MGFSLLTIDESDLIRARRSWYQTSGQTPLLVFILLLPGYLALKLDFHTSHKYPFSTLFTPLFALLYCLAAHQLIWTKAKEKTDLKKIQLTFW